MIGIILAAVVGLMSVIDLILSLKKGFYEANGIWKPLFASGKDTIIAVIKLGVTLFFCVVISIAWPSVYAVVGVGIGLVAYGWVMWRHYRYWRVYKRNLSKWTQDMCE